MTDRIFRIAVAGFQHETNTFSPRKGTFDLFVEADGWPGLTNGENLISTMAGFNIGVAGLLDGAVEQGFEVVPLSWCNGGSSGTVTSEAFDKISELLLNDLKNAGRIDGLLLDLHGAMITERFSCGDAEFLRRVRAQLGPHIPIVACLDLHANIAAEMVEYADLLVAYRTYPHVDMALTGRRTASFMAQILKDGAPKHKKFLKLPFLIPDTVACTLNDPTKGVYENLVDLEKLPDVTHISFTCGFNHGAVPHCGPAILVYGENQSVVDRAAKDLFHYVVERKNKFKSEHWNVEDAVKLAIADSDKRKGPIILADVRDNHGGGASSDTNWIFAELVRQDAKNAAVGIVCDPETVKVAHDAGVGERIEVGLGGKSGLTGHKPYQAVFIVDALSDGLFQSTGEYFAGVHLNLGPTALLSIGGVQVIVSSIAEQAADLAMFTHLAVCPSDLSILSLKSNVHYRSAFQPIASQILEVDAPGPNATENRCI